ncbi:MAG: hypothetical protein QMD85_01845 [Candidatus Aenigmarchaeota archaeon]|nr:hypothetical protein [Candidatus Aenigmarchaeota archaeon]MDI6722292.1 hypothetical protein [Candidatus Aenigmarchaeota archaeon]
MPAPYTRGYHHTKSKGHESTVNCGYCGKIVPRWKTIPSQRGFSITDPVLRKQLDRRLISTYSNKIYVCPSCARFRGIVRLSKSRQSKNMQNRRY